MIATKPYPNFRAGSVLRSMDLNNLVNYFESEDRYTRMFLLGCGIFFGLEVSWEAGKLTIKPGAGVSSDGYLFPVDSELTFSHYKIGEPLRISDVDLKYLELTESASDIALTTKFAAGSESNYNILLLREIKTTEVQGCLTGYAEAPIEKKAQIKVVAVTNEVMAQLIKKWPVVQNADPANVDPDPVLHRFGFQKGAGTTSLINYNLFTNWPAIKNNFMTIVGDDTITGIANRYNEVYAKLKDLLQFTEDRPFRNMADNLKQMRSNLTDTALPYFYDYLKMLVKAYRELAETEFFSAVAVMPKEDRFAGYVALGGITAGASPDYRMSLYRPPIADMDDEILEKPKQMLRRMMYLADAANVAFQPPTTLDITPDQGLWYPLSRRAVPFYFSGKNVLKERWSFEAKQQKRLFKLTGIDAAQDREFFLQDMDAFNFYRVQGHIGRDAKEVQANLKTLRKDLHLPFDVKLVYLASDDQAQYLVSDYDACFTDLQLLLQNTINDIRCSDVCGPDYEHALLQGVSGSTDYWKVMPVLQELFAEVKVESFDAWAEKACQKLCPRGKENNCCPSHLRNLFDICTEHQRRENEILNELLFHRFAASHPGLEPNAGVPRGGTLVLVANSNLTQNEERAKLMNDVVDAMQKNKAMTEGNMHSFWTDVQNRVGATIVADFCLPYVCCSKKPSVNVEFKPIPPVADFDELARKPMFDPKNPDIAVGYELTLKNLSHQAKTFHWQLFDKDGKAIQTQEQATDDVNTNVRFKLDFVVGMRFNVALIASRDEMNDSILKSFDLCPEQSKLVLNYNSQSAYTWITGQSGDSLVLNAAPYGGKFTLRDNKGNTLDVGSTIKWSNSPNAVTWDLNGQKLGEGVYHLSYGFDACTGVVTFTLTVPNLPTAEFTEGSRTPIYDEKKNFIVGYQLSLNNLSENANEYHWQLYDKEKNLKGGKIITHDRSTNARIDLLLSDGLYFAVSLTAKRGGLSSDEKFHDFGICNGINPKLEFGDGKNKLNGKNELNVTIAEFLELLPLDLTAEPENLPFTVIFVDEEGPKTIESQELFDDGIIKWMGKNKIQVNQGKNGVKPGAFTFIYGIEGCATATFTIIIREDLNQDEKPQPAEPNSLFNKRLLQYRTGIRQLGDSDKALAKIEKYGQADAFLLFSGSQEELDNRYEELLAILSSRLSSANDERKQKVLQLLTTATAFYLDKTLSASPQTISERSTTMLTMALNTLKENGGNGAAFLETWKPDDISNEENKNAVDTVKKILAK